MINSSYIGILKNSEFFFRFASETASSFQINYYINSQSLPNEIILNYIIFDSKQQEDLQHQIDCLSEIRYKSLLIYLYTETLTITYIMPILNKMCIHKIYPHSITTTELWKEIIQRRDLPGTLAI